MENKKQNQSDVKHIGNYTTIVNNIPYDRGIKEISCIIDSM